jgi:hypothetical protein
MSERWYKEAVIYCVDVETFQDSDGDGWGDLRGLISRLDYLSRIGVTCLWLNPIHPTPNRDNGYDVADFYGIDERLGTLGDFAELALEARERGIRILLDLVVNHRRRVAVPRLVRLERIRTIRPSPGNCLPRRADRNLDLAARSQSLVLPPLLRLPARPELGQSRRARGDQEGHGLLAAARSSRLPSRRRAFRTRTNGA